MLLASSGRRRGEVKIGEGMMSLRGAFRIAGTRTVLGSHWKESDKDTSRFKGFQFGLKPVARNSGQEAFVIDIDAVQAPDKVLSD